MEKLYTYVGEVTVDFKVTSNAQLSRAEMEKVIEDKMNEAAGSLIPLGEFGKVRLAPWLAVLDTSVEFTKHDGFKPEVLGT